METTTISKLNPWLLFFICHIWYILLLITVSACAGEFSPEMVCVLPSLFDLIGGILLIMGFVGFPFLPFLFIVYALNRWLKLSWSLATLLPILAILLLIVALNSDLRSSIIEQIM